LTKNGGNLGFIYLALGFAQGLKDWNMPHFFKVHTHHPLLRGLLYPCPEVLGQNILILYSQAVRGQFCFYVIRSIFDPTLYLHDGSLYRYTLSLRIPYMHMFLSSCPVSR
jgi:hypothetical protein